MANKKSTEEQFKDCRDGVWCAIVVILLLVCLIAWMMRVSDKWKVELMAAQDQHMLDVDSIEDLNMKRDIGLEVGDEIAHNAAMQIDSLRWEIRKDSIIIAGLREERRKFNQWNSHTR